MFADQVKMNLSFLKARQRKMPAEEIVKLIAGRITQGWPFIGQSREAHYREVAEIREEVLKQLKG